VGAKGDPVEEATVIAIAADVVEEAVPVAAQEATVGGIRAVVEGDGGRISSRFSVLSETKAAAMRPFLFGVDSP
jgi:hypothetical protein